MILVAPPARRRNAASLRALSMDTVEYPPGRMVCRVDLAAVGARYVGITQETPKAIVARVVLWKRSASGVGSFTATVAASYKAPRATMRGAKSMK